MLRNIHIGACTLLAIALGCTESYRPDVSTETGNPPVTIDSTKIALVVTRDEVHVQGAPGAVMPPQADVEVTIVRTQDVTLTDVESDGSFDVEVEATLNDVFEVRAILGDAKSDVVIVVRGGAEVIEGDGGGLSCNQQTSLGAAILESAYEAADRSCEVAADCSEVYRGASCVTGCLVGYYSDEGQRTIGDAIETVDEGVCATFEDDGCTLLIPPCLPPRGAACIDGQCIEEPEGGMTCTTCFSRELTWTVTGPGILPALIDPTTRTLSGCNTLDFTSAEGVACTADVEQCPVPSGGISIASVLTAIAQDDVVQAFEQGGTLGHPEDQSGFVYELTLDGETITYRSCAGMSAGVSCEPSGLEDLVTLLTRLGSEHACEGMEPDPEVDCTSDFEVGDCDAAFGRWWHDPQTGACYYRTYGGCGGNQNNYTSREACEAACPPPTSGACPPNRVFVEDLCLECGPAGGCAETSAACLLVCSGDMQCEGEPESMNIAPSCTDGGTCAPQIVCF